MSDSSTIQPLSVRDFISKYIADESIFTSLPEFSFIRPIAMKVKSQNCFCGLGNELKRAILIYNDVVSELPPEVVMKAKNYFNQDKVCFVIQTEDKWSTKCY